MTTHMNSTPPDDPFSTSLPTRIADVIPSVPGLVSNNYIEGVVALIWPYSSSTKVLSLLLVEPNIRLRREKGQIKVTFHSGSAKEVARSQVGIGDFVRLRLSDAEWTNTGEVVSTPGKKIDWDLIFKNRVVLDVSRDGRRLATVDFEGADTPPPTQNDHLQTPAQTHHRNFVNNTTDDLSIRLASPTTLKVKRVSSGSFLDASLDPFADDDGFVVGKGRKRTKFARHSGSWRLIERGDGPEEEPESSPVRQQMNGHVVENELNLSTVEGSAVETQVVTAPVIIDIDDSRTSEPRPGLESHTTEGMTDEEPARANMPPPSKPLRRLPDSLIEISPSAQDFAKPRLRPLPSPGLPLVSPLVQGFRQTESYFPDDHSARSELDASTDQPHGNDELPDIGSESSELGNVDDLPETPHFQASFSDHAEEGLETTISMQSDFVAVSTGQAPEDSIFQTGEEIFEEMQELQQLEELRAQAETDIYSPVGLLQNLRQESVEHDNEDMYGSTELPPKTTTETNRATADLMDFVELTWQERLDDTAVESETGDSYSAPPFPFQQSWHKEKAKIRRSSTHSSFLDGVSDEVSGSEQSIEQGVDEVLTEQTPAESELSQQTAEVLPEYPLLEIPGAASVELVEIIEGQPMASVPSLTDPSIPGSYLQEHSGPQQSSVDETLSQKPSSSLPDESLALRDQLLTPDNTQREDRLANAIKVPPEIPEQPMPPTPGQTQEPRVIVLSQTDGTNDLQFARQKDAEEALIPMTEPKSSAPLRPMRSSLASQDLAKISSPYFTPRRSTRLTPDLLSATFHEQRADFSTSNERETNRRMRLDGQQQIAKSAVAHGLLKVAQGIASNAVLKSGLTTPLSYYVPLSKLSEYYNQQIDVFAVCTATSDEPIRARSGPKDYSVTLHLVDPSLTGNVTITAQVFRPYKLALPVVQRADAVLLRSVKVQSQKRKCMLLSTDSSAWAIFPAGNAERAKAVMAGLQIETPGPPIEYGPGEVAYARELMSWWEQEGAEPYPISKAEKGKEVVVEEAASMVVEGSAKQRARGQSAYSVVKGIAKQNGDAEESPKSSEPARKSRASRRLANRTDNIENGNEISPLNSSPLPSNARALGNGHSRSISSVSLRSSSPELSRQSQRSESVVHELRDGRRYVDHEKPVQERARRKKGGNVVHELRDGATWVDE